MAYKHHYKYHYRYSRGPSIRQLRHEYYRQRNENALHQKNQKITKSVNQNKYKWLIMFLIAFTIANIIACTYRQTMYQPSLETLTPVGWIYFALVTNNYTFLEIGIYQAIIQSIPNTFTNILNILSISAAVFLFVLLPILLVYLECRDTKKQ